jgi:hypothetical protein
MLKTWGHGGNCGGGWTSWAFGPWTLESWTQIDSIVLLGWASPLLAPSRTRLRLQALPDGKYSNRVIVRQLEL